MSLIKYTNKTPKIWYASGVIIFNHDLTKTIIVKTPKGNIGFPKGGKELGERVYQTAHREVLEETGLSVEQYKHDNMMVGEKKGNPEKGVCTIYYFIAHVNKEIEDIKLKCCNDYELSFVDWVMIEDAYKILCNRRQNILKVAHDYIVERNNTQSLDKDLFVTPLPRMTQPSNFRNNNNFFYNFRNKENNNKIKMNKDKMKENEKENEKKRQLNEIMKLINP
jgi:8-oxo-dGTP pyrophosphatase MutT (NUDIX family)